MCILAAGFVTGIVVAGAAFFVANLSGDPVPLFAVPALAGTRIAATVASPDGPAPPFHSYSESRYSVITASRHGETPGRLEDRLAALLDRNLWGEEAAYSPLLRRFMSPTGRWVVELATPAQAAAALQQAAYSDPLMSEQLAVARRAIRAGYASVFVELSTPRGDPMRCSNHPDCL
jgi:hypothetical protein